MIPALLRFVDALRAEKLAVSPAELLDAGRALDLVDLTRRAEVRAALAATLAKDRRATATFDRLFDRFFAVPRAPASGERRGRVAGFLEPRQAGESERGQSRKPKPADEPRRRGGDLAQLLERTRHQGERRDGKLRRAKLRTLPAESADLEHQDLARRMTTAEERDIAREMPRLVAALKLGVARRTMRARSGRPWLRRVMRDNIAHGGVPFVIPVRAPKRKRAKVVLLVDVSFSVARAAGFFLLMASSFLTLGRKARVLAFVDRPVDATEAVRRWAARTSTPPSSPRAPRRGRRALRGEGILSRGVSFADVLDGLTDLNLDAPSDYGTAFHALGTSRLRPRGRDTVLLILGDGRTNRFDPLAWTLEDLSRGCRAVLWLVPEPRVRWGTADSRLPDYLPSTDLVVEATDLAGLARGLAELVKRL
jgi:uncharacterized protein with von Willebrand factor type A (vWA) domain